MKTRKAAKSAKEKGKRRRPEPAFSKKLKCLLRAYVDAEFPGWHLALVTIHVWRPGQSSTVDSVNVQTPKPDGTVRFPTLDRPARRCEGA